MATYRIKSKLYSDDNEKKGMGLGAKIGLGLGAAAATFGAAKTGMLGTGAGMASNKLWARAGKAIGSKGMMESGLKGYGKQAAGRAADMYKRAGATGKISDFQMGRGAVMYKNQLAKELNIDTSMLKKKASAVKNAVTSAAPVSTAPVTTGTANVPAITTGTANVPVIIR